MQVADLGLYWPKHKVISTKAIRAATVDYSIGRYDDDKMGYPVVMRIGDESNVTAWIPARYRHALRFLNFKTNCYIAALTLVVDENDMVEEEDIRKYTIIRDGMSRHVVFNDKVRKAFFKEIQNAGRRRRNAPSTEDRYRFRSVIMDTWLLEEYLFCNHDPVSRKALLRTKHYGHDPLDIGTYADVYPKYIHSFIHRRAVVPC